MKPNKTRLRKGPRVCKSVDNDWLRAQLEAVAWIFFNLFVPSARPLPVAANGTLCGVVPTAVPTAHR